MSTFAETAIELAREEADRRGVKAEFAVADASQLERLGRAFATVLDTRLIHSFDEQERRAYVGSLRRVIEVNATLYVLGFSDEPALFRTVNPHGGEPSSPGAECRVRCAAPDALWRSPARSRA